MQVLLVRFMGSGARILLTLEIGKVRLGFDKHTGQQVAVKIIKKTLLEDSSMATKLLREIAVMKITNHPNVLHLFDFYEDLDHMYVLLSW